MWVFCLLSIVSPIFSVVFLDKNLVFCLLLSLLSHPKFGEAQGFTIGTLAKSHVLSLIELFFKSIELFFKIIVFKMLFIRVA